ncbi:SDR family oxidoreductase [Chloroflexota bacterium]
MISISRLLCDTISPGDSLRYGESRQTAKGIDKPAQASSRPVVVWNCTKQCNLHCIHCYASANAQRSPGEMDTSAGREFIGDLADFGVPVVLFSGGEPLLREDLFQMARLAKERGIRVVLSTNGTLITDEVAREISDIGFAEVGISLDGIGPNNDHFRGQNGAYQGALQGIRNCIAPGSIETPIYRNGKTPEQIKEWLAAARRAPIGRVGDPKEIANVALFLASDDSSFICGETIVVDGGRNARMS